jgi:leucyl-tRNA synthetase
MRHPQTAAEATLWRAIRDRNLSYKFRRQHPIDRFIVVLCPARLCIEVDEITRQPELQDYDAARTFLEELGYHVIRFTNDDVRASITVW